MVTVSSLVVGAASAIGGAVLVVEAQTPQGPHDWSSMALLAAVVLGIGGGLVAQAMRQVSATDELVTAVKLLTQQLATESSARATQVQELRIAIERMPDEVTDKLQLREKAG